MNRATRGRSRPGGPTGNAPAIYRLRRRLRLGRAQQHLSARDRRQHEFPARLRRDLPALKQNRINRLAIDTILITHFHADHFGGVPFFTLDAMYVAKRCEPLIVAGPPGLKNWYARALDAAFPGDRKLPYELVLHEVEIDKQQKIGDLMVTPYHVIHDDTVGPCLAYRVETEGKTVTYTGDTEWTDKLLDAGRNADLFVCECYRFDANSPTHMNYAQLQEKLPKVGAKRTVLTHMGENMLINLASVREETAQDGMVVEF
jgi:ribonuclease BN (tRNA processing enzyme)